MTTEMSIKLYQQFNKILKEAIINIESKYMEFESVGLLDGFMERTYCYELYHQLRYFQEKFDYTEFTIHAEPQKRRTEFFKSILKRLALQNDDDLEDDDFQKYVMPDLLAHLPNNIDGNIVILEIKPEKGKVTEGFEKDIRVLKEFIDGGDGIQGYFRGISLLYHTHRGLSTEEKVKNLYSESIRKTIGDTWADYKDKIILLWHPSLNLEAIPIAWA